MQQFKYIDVPAAEECPNKEEEVRMMLVYAVCIAVSLNVVISAVIGYCYFRYFKKKQEKKWSKVKYTTIIHDIFLLINIYSCFLRLPFLHYFDNVFANKD